MTRIILPFIDANIIDATVTGWNKKIGDHVEEKEFLVEISTDKAAFELESPASGTLLAIYAPDKSVVPVKYVLGLIGAEGEADPGALAENDRWMAEYRAAAGTAPVKPVRPPAFHAPRAPRPSAGGHRLRATPKARRLAQSKGIDLADIAAKTGANLITEKEVEAYLAGK